jgi:hypothetical protein
MDYDDEAKDGCTDAVVRLGKCAGHFLHSACAVASFQHSNKCPLCLRIYGIHFGDQPAGTMTIDYHPGQLSGYRCGIVTVEHHRDGSVCDKLGCCACHSVPTSMCVQRQVPFKSRTVFPVAPSLPVWISIASTFRSDHDQRPSVLCCVIGHPNPGRPYSGTSRMAYLPDNEEGHTVLQLLTVSFQRRHTFTVGTRLLSN